MDTVVQRVNVIIPVGRRFVPSSVAPAVVSYVSTAITALVEVAAPLPPGKANPD